MDHVLSSRILGRPKGIALGEAFCKDNTTTLKLKSQNNYYKYYKNYYNVIPYVSKTKITPITTLLLQSWSEFYVLEILWRVKEVYLCKF